MRGKWQSSKFTPQGYSWDFWGAWHYKFRTTGLCCQRHNKKWSTVMSANKNVSQFAFLLLQLNLCLGVLKLFSVYRPSSIKNCFFMTKFKNIYSLLSPERSCSSSTRHTLPSATRADSTAYVTILPLLYGYLCCLFLFLFDTANVLCFLFGWFIVM